MIIKSLYLENYRNYNCLNIDFNKNLNIIIGDNAQGKTNILESIYTLAITKSYLGVKDKYLIKNGEAYFKIKADIESKFDNFNINFFVNNDKKKICVNDYEINRYSDYISMLRVLIFSPEVVRIFKLNPSNRRKILNIEISQLYKKYVSLLQNFNNILKQKNEYLKYIKLNNKHDDIYYSIIVDKFTNISVDVYNYRNNFIKYINNYIESIYEKITGYKGLFIKYISNIEFNDDLELMKKELNDKIIKNFDRERKYGVSFFGPQRDDICFYLNDMDLSLYGSQGQYRAAILSFKLAEIEVFKDVIKDSPILLLDDIFSEFDINKRINLINYLKSDLQAIITTTDLNLLDEGLIQNSKIFNIKHGELVNDGKEGI